jgi:murein L,D-transpeptidase YafK
MFDMPKRIVVHKSARKLELYDDDRIVIASGVALGSCPEGSKLAEGDGRTPEGEYFVCAVNPDSRYHLSLCLSYPSAGDAKRGLAEGTISDRQYAEIVAAADAEAMPPQHTALGGEIYIHGGGTDSDWTRGCIALRDDEMRMLFDACKKGTPVTILP